MPVIPCAPQTPVFGIVTFSVSEFLATYPEFTGFATGTAPDQTSPILSQNFSIAEIFLNNSCCSRVRDANRRLLLLYLLTAHITYLGQGTNDGAGNVNPPPGIVGRVNTATEGQVSVGSEYNAPPSDTMAYFVQSKYGSLYWTLTANYRTFIYVPAPSDCGPSFPIVGGGCDGC